MADGGVQSPNLPRATTVDSILGNSGGTTSRQFVTDLAAQLVASEPMRLGTMMGQLFETAADLPAITAQVTPWVTNDPDPDKIGIYKVSGGAWVWALPLPYSIIPATIGDGDAVNVRQLITALPVVDGTAIIIPVVGTNTASPVVVHINGGDAITLKTNSGLNIDEGALPGTGRLMAIREGAILRLNNDVVATAVLAAAEVAKDLAQTHAAEAAASATAASTSAASAATAGASAGATAGATAGAAAGEAAAAPAVTAATAARAAAETAANTASASATTATTKAADATTAAALAQAAAGNAQSSALTFSAWTGGLASVSGTVGGQGAEVLDSDTGTHTDPVAGTTVPNAGRYTWSTSPAGWKWVGVTSLTGLTDKVTSAARSAQIAGSMIAAYSPLVDLSSEAANVNGSSGFTRLSFWADAGDELAVGKPLDRLSILLAPDVSAASVQLSIYRRSLTSPGLNAGPPQNGDVLLRQSTYTLDSACLIGSTGGVTFSAGIFVIPEPITVVAGFSYGFEIVVLDGSGNPTTFGFARSSVQSLAAHKMGFYQTSSSWNTSSRRVAYKLETATVADAMSDKRDVADLRTSFGAATTEISATDAGDVFLPSSPFYEFAFGLLTGTDVAAGRVLRAIGGKLAVGATAAKLRLQVYARPIGNDQTLYPGLANGDILVAAVTKTIAAAGLTADGATFGTTSFDLPNAVIVDAAFNYIVRWTAFTSDGLRAPIGIERRPATGLTQLQRGWYSSVAGVPATTSSPGTAAFWWKFKVTTYTDNAATAAATAAAASAAAAATSAAQAVKQRFPGRIGASGYAGRMALPFDNSTPKTFRLVLALAQHADAVRVIFAHGGLSPMTVGKFAVAAVADPTNLALSGVSWVAGTIGGAASGIVPAAPGSGRRGIIASDWINISTLPRSDDAAKRPMLAISAIISTATTLTLIGKDDGTTDLTPWASHPVAPRVYRYNDGDCVTTPGNFTSTVNRSTGPIVGIEYLARGRVLPIYPFGDSISNAEGSGITYPGAGFVFEACKDLSPTLAGIAYDTINWGWSGSPHSQIKNHVIDVIGAGLIPDIAVVPIGSPNDVATTISNSHIGTFRSNLNEIVRQCETHGVELVQWTWIPSGSSVKTYGSSDSIRQAWNSEKRLEAARGEIILDFDAVMAGTTDGSGQVQMATSLTSDFIHPNDAGHQALKAPMKTGILAVQKVRTGALLSA